MTQPTMAIPNRWSTLPWVGAFVFAAMMMTAGIASIITAVRYVHDRHLAEAALLALIGGVVALVLVNCYYMYVLARRAVPRREGLEIGPGFVKLIESRRYIWLQILIAALAPSAGFGYSVGVWSGRLDFSAPDEAHGVFAIGVFISSLVLTGVLLKFAVRGRTVELVLTPESVSYNSWVSVRTLPWSMITALSINSPVSRQFSLPRCQVNLRAEVGRQPIEVTANTFAVGASAVYWLLRYYFEHPEDRDELGDQRAIDRLMSGRVVTRR